MTLNTKRKHLAYLAAVNERYLTAEAKLKEAIIVCRSPDLDGKPMCSYGEIAMTLGITRQSVHEYIKRWSSG